MIYFGDSYILLARPRRRPLRDPNAGKVRLRLFPVGHSSSVRVCTDSLRSRQMPRSRSAASRSAEGTRARAAAARSKSHRGPRSRSSTSTSPTARRSRATAAPSRARAAASLNSQTRPFAHQKTSSRASLFSRAFELFLCVFPPKKIEEEKNRRCIARARRRAFSSTFVCVLGLELVCQARGVRVVLQVDVAGRRWL